MSDVYGQPDVEYVIGEEDEIITIDDPDNPGQSISQQLYYVEERVSDEPAAQNEGIITDYVYSLPRPLCSMSFNGIIFEEEIPGFRTIRVEGRDSYSNTIYDYSSRINPGSRFVDFHEESKEITVTFALHGINPKDVRKRVDKLKGILRDRKNQEAQIIFNDEPDVYYIGSVSKFTEEKLVNGDNTSGQIAIKCSDIRKYAVNETGPIAPDISDGQLSFNVDYNGTIPSFPRFEVNMPIRYSDDQNTQEDRLNAFGFIDQNGNQLQFGRILPVEAEEELPKSKNIINQNFRETFPESWSKSQDQTPNHGTVADDIAGYVQHGIMLRDAIQGAYAGSYYRQEAGKDVKWETDTDPADPDYIWHGPSASHTLVESESGAVNWEMTALLTQWQNNPDVEAVNVVMKYDYDVIGCIGNRTNWEKNISIPFAAFEGTKQIPCKLYSMGVFIDANNVELVKNQASKDGKDGLISFHVPKDITISDPSGTVVFKFEATYSGGTKLITKKFHWIRENIVASRNSSTYYVIMRKYEYILDCDASNKLSAATTIKAEFGLYKGSKRIAGSVNSETFLGVSCTKQNATTSADGWIQWVIPKEKEVETAIGNKALTFKITDGGKEYSLSDTIHYSRNKASDELVNGNSTIRVLTSLTGATFSCFNGNKSMLQKIIKMEFGAFEGTSRRKCTISKVTLLGAKPQIENATKEKNGWIQWTIPAKTNIPSEKATVRINFEVETNSFGKVNVVKEFTRYRENFSQTMKDYSQLGGMCIAVSGKIGDGVMQSIAEIHFIKNQTKKAVGVCELYLGGRKMQHFDYTCLREGLHTGTNNGKNKTGATVKITKENDRYTFTVGGKTYPFINHNEYLAEEITIFFFKYKDNNALERNSIKTIKFVKNPKMETEYSEIISSPKQMVSFTGGDEITIDCATGEIVKNGVRTYSYGALGNDWEDFCLQPGPNQIQCVWDTDSGDPPEIEMYYREAY